MSVNNYIAWSYTFNNYSSCIRQYGRYCLGGNIFPFAITKRVQYPPHLQRCRIINP